MSDLSVSVLIPAFNERQSVASVVEGIRRVLETRVKALEILVIDDGSTDGTGDAARSCAATVLRHPVSRGYGKALRTGIETAKHDWVLMIDADGSYPVSEIPKLLDFAPDFDLVIGSRTGIHFWGTPLQAFLRGVYLRMAGFVVGERVPDANSGLRLVRRSLVTDWGIVQCLGYSFTTTMTLSFLQAGRFVKFIPIEFSAREGKSKVKPSRDILRTLQLMAEVILAYNPLKLFVSLAAVPAFAAVVLAAGYGFRRQGALLVAAALSALSSLACLLTGCVVDVIRMYGRR